MSNDVFAVSASANTELTQDDAQSKSPSEGRVELVEGSQSDEPRRVPVEVVVNEAQELDSELADDAAEAVVDTVEPVVDTVEPVVDDADAMVDSVESVVDAMEPEATVEAPVTVPESTTANDAPNLEPWKSG